MKKLICGILIIASVFSLCGCGALYLLNSFTQHVIEENADLPNNTLPLPAEKSGFAVEKDGEGFCLAAVGTAAKKDYQLVQTIKLKEAEILGKRVRFGATVKAIKLTGTFEVMIREVQKNGKTIRYRALRWNKYSAPKDWKKAVMEFVPAKPTYILQFYIKSRHLLPGDKVLLKEPFVEISAK